MPRLPCEIFDDDFLLAVPMAMGTLSAASAAVFHSEGVSLMFQEELPASSRGPDQVWFSMIMVNDPNAALFGSLRPSRPHPIVAAIRRPFERLAPAAPRPVEEEQEPALRPRRPRWFAAALAAGLVALGFGLTETVLEQLTAKDSLPVATAVPAARIGSTTLSALPASQATTAGSATSMAAVRDSRVTPPIAVNVTHDSDSLAPARAAAGVASARESRAKAATAPETAQAKQGRSTTSVKKRSMARQRKAALGRALAARKAPRR